MRILFINSVLRSPEGDAVVRPERLLDCYVPRFARAFVELGHSVTLVAAEEYRPLREEPCDVEMVYFPSLLPRILKPAFLPVHPGLWDFLGRRGPEFDVIFTSEVFQVSSLMAALRCPGKTVCWHEMNKHQRRFFRLPSKFWYNCVARILMRGVRVVPRSSRADRFIRRYLRNVSPRHVTHGVDIERYEAVRDKERRLTVIARLVRHKRVDLDIRHFAALVREPDYADFVLDIFGKGELEGELKALCNELGVADRVLFHGHRPYDEVVRALGRSMAMLSATEMEMSTLSHPEAVACGTPVVTTPVPDLAPDIAAAGAGIVKADWGPGDLREIIDRNAVYVERAIAMREELSLRHLAGLLLEQGLGAATSPAGDVSA